MSFLLWLLQALLGLPTSRLPSHPLIPVFQLSTAVEQIIPKQWLRIAIIYFAHEPRGLTGHSWRALARVSCGHSQRMLAVHHQRRGSFSPGSDAGARESPAAGGWDCWGSCVHSAPLCVIPPCGLSTWQPQVAGPLPWWLKAPRVNVPREPGTTCLARKVMQSHFCQLVFIEGGYKGLLMFGGGP